MKRNGPQGETDHKIQTNTREPEEKDHLVNKQVWSKYFEHNPYADDIDLRKRRTAKVRRLESNRKFWSGVFVEAGRKRT